jgi:hypothetical protein
MVKSKRRLAIKLFVIVWVVLAIHVTLKLTFNYWQPYVIPNETLSAISDFIDSHSVIKIIIDLILYILNGYIMICCSLQCWHLGKKKNIITIILLIIGYFFGIYVERTIGSLLLSIIYPLILNKKKWLTIILTFILNFVFLFLSLFLEGFATSNDMQYICKVFLQFDYYIMLILNYFVFNLLRKDN